MTPITKTDQFSDAAEQPAGTQPGAPGDGVEETERENAPLDPADLKAVAEAIGREFPLVSDRSGLVLYDVDPGQLQAQWQISPDDIARGRSSFPVHDADVGLLLRLRRLGADGSTRDVASISRRAGGAGLQGQVRFPVEDADAVYQAEMGLASPGGGWLLLVRSNKVTPPAVRSPVRRPVAEHAGRPRQRGEAEASGQVPPAAGRPGQSPPSFGMAEPPPIVARQARSGERSGPVDAALIEPALAADGPPLDPVFPLAMHGGSATFARYLGGKTAFAALDTTPTGELRFQGVQSLFAPAFEGKTGEWADLPPPILPSTAAAEREAGSGGLPVYDPRAALSSRELSHPLYGPPDLELHAEVRVWGRASPGSLIDVFGVRLRVGPDGHFSLRRPLDDPELLTRALAVGPGTPPGADTE